MNNRITAILPTSIIVAIAIAIASCQHGPKENEDTSTASSDSAVSQTLEPAESGYADVNGLRMYYEVYGVGKPIVLLHGSYMSIPLNWSHIIPLLAKDRKV